MMATAAALRDSSPLHLTLPLSGGQELRLRCEGKHVALESWRQYPDGHAMMGGGFTLGAHDLRLLVHSLRTMLWSVERREAAP
jgi:membrane-associated phospholipid phosphatase